MSDAELHDGLPWALQVPHDAAAHALPLALADDAAAAAEYRAVRAAFADVRAAQPVDALVTVDECAAVAPCNACRAPMLRVARLVRPVAVGAHVLFLFIVHHQYL